MSILDSPVFHSLCDDDRRTFYAFIVRSDEDFEGTAPILRKVIDLFEREPKLASIDISSISGQAFLQGDSYNNSSSSRLFPSHVLLLSYGKPETDTEIDLTLRMLTISSSQMGESSDETTIVDLGVNFVPYKGWSLLGIALICQCHPRLIEYLLVKNTHKQDWAAALLAAIWGRQLDFAKSIKESRPRESESFLEIRSRLLRPGKKIYVRIVDIVLMMPVFDGVLDFLQLFFDTHTAPVHSEVCLGLFSSSERHLERPNTACFGLVEILSEFIQHHKIQDLSMQTSCWTFDTLLRFMSKLERNDSIRTLLFRQPDHLLLEESVQGLTRMLRGMRSLEHISFYLEEDSWLNNQCTFEALAEAFPKCNARSVSFRPCYQGALKLTKEPTLTSLSGTSAFEKILNNIERLSFVASEDQEHLLDVVARAAKFSPTLETINFIDGGWSEYPDDRDPLPPRRECPKTAVLLDAVLLGEQPIGAFERLAHAFAKHNVLLGELRVSLNLMHVTEIQSLRTLIPRARDAKLLFSECWNKPSAIDHSICPGIHHYARNISELTLDVTFCGVKDVVAMRERVFETLTDAIDKGRLRELRCPLSLVRHNLSQLALVWTKLKRLKLKGGLDFDYYSDNDWEDWYDSAGWKEYYRCMSTERDNDDQEKPSGPLYRFGEDLIRLSEASTSLVELFTDFSIRQDHASVLRHQLVWNYAQPHEIFDVKNASMMTVISVLSRVNESLTKRLYSFQFPKYHNGRSEWDWHDRKIEPEKGGKVVVSPSDEAARVSAAFDILLQSVGILTNWCKENDWRWKAKLETDLAISHALDVEGSEQPKKTKRPRL